MDESSIMLVYLLGGIVSLLIFYWIILNAVRSANAPSIKTAKLLRREAVMRLIQDGKDLQEIRNIYEESDEEFWKRIEELFTTNHVTTK